MDRRYPQAVTANGVLAWPHELPGPGRHFVYHLCCPLPGIDPEQAVAHIYVGVTSNLRQRLARHARKWWFVAVAAELGELIEYPTRAAADAAERQLIHLYQPAMNRAGRLLVVGP